MNVGVIGSGGREHALVWKLRQSPSVEKLYAVPGSAAMADLAECVPLPVSDLAGITDYAVRQNIDLLVVGPEVPLTEGIADLAEEKGIAVFGPSKAAARLEGSKSFAKMLMKKYGIPTADYESFTDGAAAKAYIKEKGSPIVVKADGLAAGKGVVVAMTTAEALAAVDAMMEDKIFGDSGGRIVVEEYMSGEEASILAFVDGETIVPMPAAQDHKRIFDGDKGPNTGGMGAYAPAPAVTEAIYEEVTERILKPTVAALAAEGILYRGCLYAGLMLTTEGVKVVEFNCRFGDPETQAVLPLMDFDFFKMCRAITGGTLKDFNFCWKK
ncbi:phosphoribosylamine--glycine ligase, partial [Colibacter massiliensis]|uniref:phosphoribosylamine--glycine ligase n=1 Tax=Colibacter massiliensis TaxID=1852379 RepID=UPI003C6F3D6E